MKKTLAIIGSGQLGQQIAHYAISDNHYKDVVFFDDFTTQKVIKGFKILGKTSDVISLFEKKKFDEIVIGIGYNHIEVRKKIFELLCNEVPFGKIVHSSSWIDSTALISEGCVIYPYCCIDAHTIIDNNTIVNLSCTIAHDTKVGRHCFLSPSVSIAGFVEINEMCILGINATIIDNISIVSKTRLGGGTVVIKNIEKKGLYVGNPQRFIK